MNSKYVKPAGGMPTSDLEENAPDNVENVNTSLQNLGSYDIVVDNGYGTATITRKTGYAYLDPSNNIKVIPRANHPSDYLFKMEINVPAFYGSVQDVKCNTLAIDNPWAKDRSYCIWYQNKAGYVQFCLNPTTDTTVEQARQWLSEHPTYIQYKLITSYTETVIDNQPIATLDQNGEQWLRSEWEKGLNLIDDSSVAGTVLNHSGMFGVPVTLEAGDYSICMHVNGVGTVINVFDVMLTDVDGTKIIAVSDSDVQTNACNYVYYVTVTASQASQITKLLWYYNNDHGISGKTLIGVSIYKGRVQYPYHLYNGEIIHRKDIEDVYSPDNLPPYGTLTFTGAVNDSFSANQDKTINIPTIAGVTPDLTIGTVTTGAPGTDASATITGTAENPVLNLTIPRGKTGADGVTPNISATASVSNTTGTPSVTVTKSGTAANPSFNFAFSNIKGEKGDAASSEISADDITSGILPVARGGTGVGNLNSAMADLIQASTTSTISASEYIPAAPASGNTAYRYTFTQLKDWLVSQGLGGSPKMYVHNIHITIEHEEYSLSLCLPPIVSTSSTAYASIAHIFAAGGLFPYNTGAAGAEFMPASGYFTSDDVSGADIIGLQYNGVSPPARIRLKYVYPTINDVQDPTLGAGHLVGTVNLILGDLRIESETVSAII